MKVRYRPMRARDVGQCVGVIAAHPVLASRYGPAISYLGQSWLHLLSDGSCTTAVVEVEVGSRTRIAAVGVSVFVTDKFVCDAKTPPSFWIGPELTRRSRTGEGAVPMGKEIAEAKNLQQ